MGDLEVSPKKTPQAEKTYRRVLLEEAIDLVDGSRDRPYGPPFFNHRAAADLKDLFWTHFAMARQRACDEINVDYQLGRASPHGEAIDLLLTKLGRIATGSFKKDNYADIAGYISNAFECAVEAGAE
jgi:hypothetical protein